MRGASDLQLDIAVNVVGPAVGIPEQLRIAENARAMRNPETEVGFAQGAHTEHIAHADVHAGVQIIEQLRCIALPARLVARFDEGDVFGKGNAHAEADSFSYAIPPTK